MKLTCSIVPGGKEWLKLPGMPPSTFQKTGTEQGIMSTFVCGWALPIRLVIQPHLYIFSTSKTSPHTSSNTTPPLHFQHKQNLPCSQFILLSSGERTTEIQLHSTPKNIQLSSYKKMTVVNSQLVLCRTFQFQLNCLQMSLDFLSIVRPGWQSHLHLVLLGSTL